MTGDFSALDWRNMSREEVDRSLNNGAAVTGSTDIIAGWEKRSAALRQQHPQHLDLRYGPRERNRIDFLKARDNGPDVAVHPRRLLAAPRQGAFHAGCGRADGARHQSRADRLHASAGRNPRREIHAGIDFLAGQLPALGGDGSGIVVSGWSAGGHLTAMALSHSQVKGGMAKSGIYGLEPIRAAAIKPAWQR